MREGGAGYSGERPVQRNLQSKTPKHENKGAAGNKQLFSFPQQDGRRYGSLAGSRRRGVLAAHDVARLCSADVSRRDVFGSEEEEIRRRWKRVRRSLFSRHIFVRVYGTLCKGGYTSILLHMSKPALVLLHMSPQHTTLSWHFAVVILRPCGTSRHTTLSWYFGLVILRPCGTPRQTKLSWHPVVVAPEASPRLHAVAHLTT